MTSKFKVGKTSKEDYIKFLKKDAVRLLTSMMKRDETETKAKHLRRLISMKNI